MKNQTVRMHENHIGIKVNRFNSCYPTYTSSDKIYHKFRKVKDIKPVNTSKTKETDENEKIKALREKYLLDEMCGNYLDMPEGELDNEQEEIIANDDKENT